MTRHFVVIASSYKLGTRIALDYIYDEVPRETIKSDLLKIKEECGKDVAISTHSLSVESRCWDSVIKSDPFFEGIVVLDSVSDFIYYANQDKTLTGIEVANYILSKIPACTHLKLEKLVYLSFADYLYKTKQTLFDNRVYAFHYGPVIEDVYKKFSIYNDKILNYGYKENEMPFKSRILNSENGLEKLQIINNVLQKYGSMDASTLVDITHKKNSPWEYTYDGGYYTEIPVDVILERHCYEC